MSELVDEALSAESGGVNVIPFAVMAGGWLAPLLMFWLYVWGPLRPFNYPRGDFAPSVWAFLAAFAICALPWWLPRSYFAVHRFERRGRIYEALGVRLFRTFVPDGDFANRWRQRSRPGFRIIRNRASATMFIERTEYSEKSHLMVMLVGVASALHAWRIGWTGWAAYLTVGNVVVNLYPILLQRYTRTRFRRLATNH